jgi:hypothetical protein
MKQKERDFLYLMLIIVAIFGFVELIKELSAASDVASYDAFFNNDTSSWPEPEREQLQDPSIIYSLPTNPKHGQIVYFCPNSQEETEICGINADGSDKRVVVAAHQISPYSISYPLHINMAGDIAFNCATRNRDDDNFEFEEASHICVINSDGTSLRHVPLPDGSLYQAVWGFGLNNLGQMTFPCLSFYSGIFDPCVFGFGEGSVRNIGPTPDQGSLFTAFSNAFEINDKGSIIFSCVQYSMAITPDYDIADLCGINFDGTGRKVIINQSSDLAHLKFQDHQINNAGDIVYFCTDADGGSDICVTSYEGHTARILLDDTNGEELPNYSDLSMNNSGEIVFKCEDVVNSRGICSMNLTGVDYRRLVDLDDINMQGLRSLKINDHGHVVFYCMDSIEHANICIINSDGSNFRVLVAGISINSLFYQNSLAIN